MERCPVFRTCVHDHLHACGSLRLAVREGMSPPLVADFWTWLVDTVETMFYEKASVYTDEVGAFISDIVDNELDVLIEDGSIEFLSGELCRAFSSCRSGDQQAVLESLRHLSLFTSSEVCTQQDGRHVLEEDTPGIDATPDSVEMETEEAQSSVPTSTDPDGWCLVRRKAKSKNSSV